MQELAIIRRFTAAVLLIALLLFPPVALTLTKLADQSQSPPTNQVASRDLSAGSIGLPLPRPRLPFVYCYRATIRFELVFRTDSIALPEEMK